MRVLVACEFTGIVRDAFAARGHDAMSCDLLPSERPGEHYEGDVLDLIDEPFDLVIAHPPCTYLSNSGVTWLYRDATRWQSLIEGAAFFRRLFEFNTQRLAVENPVQHKWARMAHGMGKPTQVVQPYMFGHMETKATGLWLRGLPKLQPTDDVKAATFELPPSERGRIHWLPPSADRWKLRSATYPGLAAAMAEQWGSLFDQEVSA